MPEVKDHEPRLALDGEEDGLAFYRKIIEQAPDYLNSNGRIYFEIGAEQGEDMIRLMTDRGFSEVKVHKDLAGLDRIATGIYSRR
jgi:release factor glutamine methyltransferase